MCRHATLARLLIVLADERRFVFGYRTAPSSDKRNAIFKIGYWAPKFGHPNDEALSGHRYYRNGLTAYSAYEVIGSSGLKSYARSIKCPFRQQRALFSSSMHFVFSFHDGTLSSSHRSDPSGFSQTAIFCLMCLNAFSR
jgi:hypothetical protein